MNEATEYIYQNRQCLMWLSVFLSLIGLFGMSAGAPQDAAAVSSGLFLIGLLIGLAVHRSGKLHRERQNG